MVLTTLETRDVIYEVLCSSTSRTSDKEVAEDITVALAVAETRKLIKNQ